MRTVYPAEMVAHIWANRSQEFARTATRNLYFEGSALYSYGDHYVIAAHLPDGRILWNDHQYSVTTSRHSTYALRALSAEQRIARLHVPELHGPGLRDLQDCIESKSGRMPKLAKKCADAVIRYVRNMANMRHGAWPMITAYRYAKDYETTGKALCAIVSGRKKVKWPLPDLPVTIDGIPAKKAERAAFIRQYAAHQLAEEYREHAARFETFANSILEESAFADDYTIGAAFENLRVTKASFARAGEAYFAATGKKLSPASKLCRLYRRVCERAPAIEKAHEEKKTREACDVVRMAAVQCWQAMRERKRIIAAGKQYRKTGRLAHHWRHDDAMQHLRQTNNLHLVADYLPIIERAARAYAWHCAAEHIESARGHIETAESYRPKYPIDALSNYKAALGRIRNVRVSVPAFAALHADTLADIESQCEAAIEHFDAEIKAREAAIIDDWINGRSNVRPQYGTYARIKGGIVETSRGAFVPLAHACRLAKIARRVIAAGGREWAAGEGPIVGHFRVTRIGADGSAVIGCHNFEAAEGMRLLVLLENCAECQTETAAIAA